MASSAEAVVGACFMAVSGFLLWRRSMKVGKLSSGTATSKIATAAKGFVELTGIARPLSEIPLKDPIQLRTCVWFHVITEEKPWLGKSDDWKVINTITSERPFVIEDGTGYCAVSCTELDVEQESPEVVKVKSTLRHKIWRLHNGDSLYALGHLVRIKEGEFVPPAVAATAYDRKKKIAAHAASLLTFWKQDRRTLISRFDTDGNGRVDWHEWEKAQATARELAEKKIDAEPVVDNSSLQSSNSVSESLLEKITHKLVRPNDGRPLLIAKGNEKSLTSRKRWQSIFGLLLFVGGVAILFTVFSGR